MGKKIPLLISTLITLASSVTATASVGAVSDTAPWSFDDILAARQDLLNEIDSRCSRDMYSRPACGRNIAAEKGIIYSEGVMAISDMDVLPASIDLASGTLDYYLPNHSFRRDLYYNPPYYDNRAAKLQIVQLRSDHSDDWQTALMSDISNPVWRVLYDGGDLYQDYRGTIQIEKPIFSAEYEKVLWLYTETYYGDQSFFALSLDGCADGMECDARYGYDDINIHFENPSYNAGYSAGYDTGYHDGTSTGHDIGYNDGSNSGYTNGHNAGYSEGREDGYEAGKNDGYLAGYETGHDDGYAKGRADGLTEGYLQGQTDGRSEGLLEGYNNGYSTGREEGTTSGYGAGYAEGYETGYAEGYSQALSESLAVATVSDSSTEEQADEGTATLPGTEKSPLTTDIIISVATSTNGLSTPLSLAPRTPDTGSPTTSEPGSAEITWWLGLIFISGIAAAIWLFAPIRHKK